MELKIDTYARKARLVLAATKATFPSPCMAN